MKIQHNILDKSQNDKTGKVGNPSAVPTIYVECTTT